MEKLAAHADGVEATEVAVEAALKIDEVIRTRRIVNRETNPDVKNLMRNDIDDLFYELGEREGVNLGFADIDDLTEQCLRVARVRYTS